MRINLVTFFFKKAFPSLYECVKSETIGYYKTDIENGNQPMNCNYFLSFLVRPELGFAFLWKILIDLHIINLYFQFHAASAAKWH